MNTFLLARILDSSPNGRHPFQGIFMSISDYCYNAMSRPPKMDKIFRM